jgi:N-acetylglutamate synthase-like GNAT family acetyltransferase
MNERIFIAKTDVEIQDCYAVMAELRSHVQPSEFLAKVKRQAEDAGCQLAYLMNGGVKAVAGFRISEWLAAGKYLCVEDLVAKSGERSKGYGGLLFDWLVEHARENSCEQIHLVSRVSRFGAHRFYLQKRMNIEAHYFSLDLREQTKSRH